MSNKLTKLIILILLVIALGVATAYIVFYRQGNKSDKYNPNYADAIQMRKPELCKKINYALISGPTDETTRLYGLDAITTCEEQAKAGIFACECDPEFTLNEMRLK